MSYLLCKINRGYSMLAALLLALFVMGTNAFATAGPIETAVTTAITDAKTAGDAVLVVAISVLASFILFKLVKRAGNKV